MSDEMNITFDETNYTVNVPVWRDTALVIPLANGKYSIPVAPEPAPFTEAGIRRIFAEEIEKALPRITSAALEQMEQRVRLAKGTHNDK